MSEKTITFEQLQQAAESTGWKDKQDTERRNGTLIFSTISPAGRDVSYFIPCNNDVKRAARAVCSAEPGVRDWELLLSEGEEGVADEQELKTDAKAVQSMYVKLANVCSLLCYS